MRDQSYLKKARLLAPLFLMHAILFLHASCAGGALARPERHHHLQTLWLLANAVIVGAPAYQRVLENASALVQQMNHPCHLFPALPRALGHGPCVGGTWQPIPAPSGL